MMQYILVFGFAAVAGVSFHLGQIASDGWRDADFWSGMYKNSLIERTNLETENESLRQELNACWKCINARSNKGHWEKQKRVKGRFAK